MHSHSSQDTELKLHSYVDDSPRQVEEGLMILRYPMGLKIKGLSLKNLNSTCIRTVIKIKSWNFKATSMTLRDRSWRGNDSTILHGAQK